MALEFSSFGAGAVRGGTFDDSIKQSSKADAVVGVRYMRSRLKI